MLTELLPSTHHKLGRAQNLLRFQCARTDSNGRPPDSKSARVEGIRQAICSRKQGEFVQISAENMGSENVGISRQFRVDLGCFAPALPPAPNAQLARRP